jgi:cytochrome c biogenesis protein CcmG/thiol:disulfide interchange protein DsbE
MSRPHRRQIVLAATLVLALAACGGDDDSSAATLPALPVEGGPTATVPAGVPPELLAAVGPVDVGGAPLPALGDATVDTDPALGLPAPTLLGLDFQGQPVRVDAAADGPTMVVFLAHYCPHCNAEVPRLNDLRDEGRLPDDLNVVAVATGSDPGRPNFPPGEWLADKDWTWPAMADGVDLEAQHWVAAHAYGVNAYPFITLVDGDGKVAARWSGETEADETVARIEQYLHL